MFFTGLATVSVNKYFSLEETFLKAKIMTVTPAFPLALLTHLKDWCAKSISISSFKIKGHNKETCSPWQTELVETKPNLAFIPLMNFAPL